MASFDGNGLRFYFVNNSNTPIEYDLIPATNNDIQGKVNPGDRYETIEFDHNGFVEKGDVPVISISGVPSPGFRFWSGDEGGSDTQYINVLAGN